MSKQFILGLDIGTSSVRAALFDDAGNLLTKTLVKNERALKMTADGGSEIDADEALLQVANAIDDVLKKTVGVRGEITHVASSCFWHSLVGVDANGRATTKVLSWADTRSREHVSVLRRKFGEAEIHDRTGARFHSSFWPAKLLWLRKEFSAVWKKTTRWMSLSDLIALRLLDDSTTSVSMASGTGVFDIRSCEWDAEILKYLGLSRANLPLIRSDDPQTPKLKPTFAKRWPRLRHALWFPAIGDGAGNNVGAGCVTRSKAALMIGTSGAIRVAYRGEPPEAIPEGLWCYRVDRQRVIIGGALSDGGGLYEWLKKTLRLGKDSDVEAAIAKRKPAAHGLIFLPFLAGERSTGYHEFAKGAIIGLQSANDAIDITQAAFESVAFRFAEIFDQLNTICGVRKIVASGGALRDSRVWTQMMADVLGRKISLPGTHEASSRGAVLLALETIGKIVDIEQIPTPAGEEFSADAVRKRLYGKAREQHKNAYKKYFDQNPS